MAMNRQGFGKRLGRVIDARDVMDRELALTYPILDPVEPQVDGFGMFGGNRAVG